MVTIIGVDLQNRAETALDFQKILTEFGCGIKTRIGLHSAKEDACTNYGIVLLEVTKDENALIAELSKYWCVQTMKFE